MAATWIKMRTSLATSPKVVRMASALKADRFRIVGGLHAVWSLFDEHSEDGILEGYTALVVDDLIAWPGFLAAMIAVEWAAEDGETVALPEFDTHNGQSAKRRAQEAERKRRERKASASGADKKRTREEKRREEKSFSTAPTSNNPPPDGSISGPEPTSGGVGFEIEAEQLCRQLTTLGCLHCNPSSVDLLAAFAEGVTQRTLLEHWKTAHKGGKRNPFAYAITAARNDRKAGAASVSSTEPPLPTMGTSGSTESPLEKEINLAWHEFNYGRLSAEERDSKIETAMQAHDAARNSDAASMADSRAPSGDQSQQKGKS